MMEDGNVKQSGGRSFFGNHNICAWVDDGISEISRVELQMLLVQCTKAIKSIEP